MEENKNTVENVTENVNEENDANKYYYIMTVSENIPLPGVTMEINTYFSYNLRLIDNLKVGDHFIVAYSDKENSYSNLSDSMLPGCDVETAVLCRIEKITKNDQTYTVKVVGIDTCIITLSLLDNAKKLVLGRVTTKSDNVDARSKIEAYLKFVNTYKQFRMNHKMFPELPDYSETSVDLIPFKIAAFLNASDMKKLEMLKAHNTLIRFNICHSILESFNYETSIEYVLNQKVGDALAKNQKEFILRTKAKAIHDMLKEFDGDDQVEKYQKMIEKHPENYPTYILEAIKGEISKFKSIPSVSPEAGLTLNYLDILVNLPYFKYTEDNHDINEVKRILDEDHYALEKQKDRIVQYLAVKEVTKSLKSHIICLYGPPGVGKTSLAISIARALNRNFQKVSLGGVHDESEIRGHRRTYVGALPGKIITAIKKAGVNNPVILLDELDKVKDGGWHGNPASALLEVLDPEQNVAFEDNYVAYPFDLSNVLFICTANDISEISGPLRDRLEMIPLYSYTKYEKMHIAKDYIMDIEYKANGITKENLEFSDEALDFIIENYTRESGVRNLQRQIGTIIRKYVVDYLASNKTLKNVIVDVDLVKKYLGKVLFYHDKKVENSQVGIINGLAYTNAGGELLQIEVNAFPGKGNIIRTGNLGDVMKESCSAAYSYLRSIGDRFGLTKDYFENTDLHIHFPDTSTPKDGPSAGLATALAILSAITNVKIRNDVAITGEIDLRGNAMIIGGLREKTMAAVREHIRLVLCPSENHDDVLELPKEVTDSIKIVEIKTLDEAINYCFMENPYVDKYKDLYKVEENEENTKKKVTKRTKKSS